jgi:hypothetical protein
MLFGSQMQCHNLQACISVLKRSLLYAPSRCPSNLEPFRVLKPSSSGEGFSIRYSELALGGRPERISSQNVQSTSSSSKPSAHQKILWTRCVCTCSSSGIAVEGRSLESDVSANVRHRHCYCVQEVKKLIGRGFVQFFTNNSRCIVDLYYT